MDFDEFIDRRPTESLKWNLYDEDVLPLWVADTDFLSPPAVVEELQKRISHGIFGYGFPPKGLDEVIIKRMQDLYSWDVNAQEISYVPGIVTGFNLAMRCVCDKGDTVIFQTPAYPPFVSSPACAGLTEIQNPMYLGDDGQYQVDFDLFEEQIIENNVKVFILCNPQNPTGRVFSMEELEKFADICLKHKVLICSDEIHCDIVYDGRKHIPIASLSPEVSKITATFLAPSKTYNIAGLHASVAIIQDEVGRKKYLKYKQYLISDPGTLSLVAAKAAYEHGGEWLREQIAYLQANRDYLDEVLPEALPGVSWSKPESTFLGWLDFRQSGIEGNCHKFFIDRARVALNDGAAFGEGCDGFLRINFGCTRATLEKAIQQMSAAMNSASR
ncbi:MAG: pyridoxal phosphate-dependent aminotransferase [Chloroflexi bacterium]|jgi:cystathionine beta-lyase|nr:pyridoxal phosphate-dependent aminotransferase [Chloroflexota bacterium]